MTKKGLENITDSIKYRFFEWGLSADYLDPAEAAIVFNEETTKDRE